MAVAAAAAEDHGSSHICWLAVEGSFYGQAWSDMPVWHFVGNFLANFSAIGCHILFGPKSITFERSKRSFMWSEDARVHCGERIHYLNSHSGQHT